MTQILIVEDSPTIQTALQQFLQEKGFDSVVASTGEEGVALAQDQKPKLAIVDTVLPGMDGFETCRKIKESDQGPAPQVIVMTGNMEAVDAGKAREAGADEYVAKTKDFDGIFSAIEKLLSP